MLNKKFLKSKINIIKSSYKITKSLEMISISNIKILENRLLINNKYNNFLIQLFNNINNNIFIDKSAFSKELLYIIIFTDKGLCGNLNIGLFKYFLVYIYNRKYKYYKKFFLLLLGKKSLLIKKYILKLNINIKVIDYEISIKNIFLKNNLIMLIKKILNIYKLNNKLQIYLLFNSLYNNIIKVIKTNLFPIKNFINIKYNKNYIYENDINIINNKILYKYTESVIYNAILKNLISENYLRIFIMKNAYKNSENLFNKLNIMYNKLRQFNITKEIIELISTLDTL